MPLREQWPQIHWRRDGQYLEREFESVECANVTENQLNLGQNACSQKRQGGGLATLGKT